MFDLYCQDRGILLRELAQGALPALQLRSLVAHLGIRVVSTTSKGVANACPTTTTIFVGGLVDQVAHRGPFHLETREFTSVLAWGLGYIRLSALDRENEARSYAAAFLCPENLLRTAAELPAIRRGSGVESLAKRLAVASWVVEEALINYKLVDRILTTIQGGNDGGTISKEKITRGEPLPQEREMGR